MRRCLVLLLGLFSACADAILSQTDFPPGYIIDPAGVIRYRFSGFDGPTIDAAVAALFR